MATDWDKLQKLKRDHPKAKFAGKEISRQRKKQPTNPYLLVTTLSFFEYDLTLTLLFQAWQADVSLELGISASWVISKTLFPILESRPPITDTRLLVYVYKTFANALRKEVSGYPNLVTTGPIVLKAWETAAKTLPSRKARLDFWSALFTCALREDCWEDVRWVCRAHVSSYRRISFQLTYLRR
jgi:N-terminal acetyltransferase B complex non-catalytic subunit